MRPGLRPATRGEAAAEALAGVVHGAFCNHCHNIPCTTQSSAGGMFVSAKLPGLTNERHLSSSRGDQPRRCAPGDHEGSPPTRRPPGMCDLMRLACGQGGSHRDARWRRARAASGSEAGSDAAASGSASGSGADSDSEGGSGGDEAGARADPYAALDDVSDDDVREELRREQQQQLLAASQVFLYEGPGVYAWRMLSRAQRPDVAGGTGPM